MNWLEHEYLVPIVIGNSHDAYVAAKRIYKASRIKAHIFAERFSFLQKMTYNCHTVSPMREEFLVESLKAFADSLEEFYCPIIVICNGGDKQFVEKYSSFLESSFVAVELNDLFKKAEGLNK